MQRIHINEVKNHVGEQVKIAGFVQVVRNQGSIKFMELRDITGVIQIVVTKEIDGLLDLVSDISLESVVEITGLAKEEKQAVSGYELEAKSIEILSKAEPELPIPVIEKGERGDIEQAILFDWRSIDLRRAPNSLIYQVWTYLELCFREYWVEHGYIEIHSPKLIATASESGAEVFEVKYFDRKAYLSQSPQFYKQMAMSAGFEKVFEVGPVFRAEPSFTKRHATEFVGYDIEISYVTSHEDVMKAEEELILYTMTKLKEKFGDVIKETFGVDVVVPATPFPRITMAEAKKILKEEMKVEGDDEDLSPEEERKISEYAQEKFGHEFVFVTDYPVSVRPFYHMRYEDKPELTKSFDLLWKGLEVTTGAQREHRYDVLVAQAQEKNMNVESLDFYLNFFRYGCPPHGGFGMGANRFVMQLLGIDNVRDASFVYRGVKRLQP